MQCKSEPSPLAQGTLSEHCSHLVRPRFIPACAGNSFATLPSIFERPVHPRLRGELINRYKQQVRFNGSSPLTRGTPAMFRTFFPFHAVHPRLRGELPRLIPKNDLFYGSSPLTRGTLTNISGKINFIRFIPAYAGNSRFSFAQRERVAVHPRFRGELDYPTNIPRQAVGSSPLTRGTPHSHRKNTGAHRFIPAYAGNSRPCSEKNCSMSVHPRLRGELVLLGKDIQQSLRFIPAYAGNSEIQRS